MFMGEQLSLSLLSGSTLESAIQWDPRMTMLSFYSNILRTSWFRWIARITMFSPIVSNIFNDKYFWTYIVMSLMNTLAMAWLSMFNIPDSLLQLHYHFWNKAIHVFFHRNPNDLIEGHYGMSCLTALQWNQYFTDITSRKLLYVNDKFSENGGKV